MQFTHLVVAFLQAHGTLNTTGVVALFIVFSLSGLVPIPRTALCLASGAIFGIAVVFVILPATTLCSLIGFFAARYLFSASLYRYAERRVRLRAVLAAVDKEGWKIVALMRFWSVMPTFMQNYVFGLTRIDTLSYGLATFVFTIPQICVYVYLGALGRAAMLGQRNSALTVVLMTTAGVCILIAILIIVNRVRATMTINMPNEPELVKRGGQDNGLDLRKIALTVYRHLTAKQFWMFVITSGFAAVIHWLSRYLLTFVIPYTVALVVAYGIGMAVAYILNLRYVFTKAKRPAAEQVRYFVIINLAAFPFVWGAAYLLSEIVFPHFRLTYHPREIAHAFAICLPVVVNFFAHKFITFKDVSE